MHCWSGLCACDNMLQDSGEVCLSPKYKQSQITRRKTTVDIIRNNFTEENGIQPKKQ